MAQNIYRSWARVAGAPPSPGREGGDMADRMQYREDDSRYDSSTLKKMRNDVAHHARDGLGKVSGPKALALFETTAEVLQGLQKHYKGFEHKNELEWKALPTGSQQFL
jgi:hypothetical protein